MMRIYKKIILSIVVCLMMFTLAACQKGSKNVSENEYDYKTCNEYMGSGTYPEGKEGTIFAGWYTDNTYTKPVAEKLKRGTAFAKFVDEKVLAIELQLEANTTEASTETSVCLVTSVDSKNYSKVIFIVEREGKQEYESTEICEKAIDINGVEYNSKDMFCDDSEYIVTANMEAVTRNDATADNSNFFGKSITVTPKWETLDGTVVEGLSRTFEINDLIYEAEIENLPNAEYGHVWGTLAELVDRANTNGGTGETEEVIITVLKDVAPSKTLEIKKNVTIQNLVGKSITVSRGNSHTDSMFSCAVDDITFKLKRMEGDSEGSLTIDAATSEQVATSAIRNGTSSIANTKFLVGEGVTVRNANSSTDGGAIFNYGTVEIAGTIMGNNSEASGGAIFNYGTVHLNGGEIVNNVAAVNGGAIFSCGDIIISDGKIANNKAGTFAGGVFADKGSMTMDGGAIESNEAAKGAGIAANVIVTINDGKVEKNKALGYGAGIYVGFTATLNMNGGSIKDNEGTESHYGADAHVLGVLNQNGGTIGE